MEETEDVKPGFAFWKMLVIVSTIAFLAVIGYFAYFIYDAFYNPQLILSGKKTEYFYIHTGWNENDVLNSLYEKSYIKKRALFEWLVERKKYKNYVFPGRYLLSERMSYNEIINLFRSGKQIPVEISFDNLHTKQQIAARAGKFLETDSVKIMELLNDNLYLEKFNYARETVKMAFIANTYIFNWNTSAEQFFERMVKESDKFWNSSRCNKSKQLSITRFHAVTLASIVEMESYRKDERPVIAGVYLNRLKIGMPLQADPTVIYAIGDFKIKRVLKKHLEIDSPYNTYLNAGLPPEPICIPSISSIDAVLDYDKNNYLYFCAKEDFSGYHNFAVTYAQHELNAKKYRSALNKMK